MFTNKIKFSLYLKISILSTILTFVCLAPVYAVENKNLTKVEVIKISPRQLKSYGSYVGYLTPAKRVTVSSEIAGTIQKAGFTVGDKVNKGEILVEFNTDRLIMNKKLGQSNHNLALMDYSREKSLYIKKLSTLAKVAALKNRLDVAKISLDMANLDLKKSKVIAPLTGIVKIKYVEKGEYLGHGKKVVEILEISSVLAKVDIPEQDIQFAKKGKRVGFLFDALPKKQFTGIITSIGVEADRRSRSFPIEVSIHNPSGNLLPGMLARARLLKTALSNQIMIPRHAIQEDEKGSFVFVANSTKVKKRYIQSGISYNNQVQVKSGLKFGEFLIETGQQLITAGDIVKINKVKKQNPN
jgi:membrane fusion protein, multidrug efflux system